MKHVKKLAKPSLAIIGAALLSATQVVASPNLPLRKEVVLSKAQHDLEIALNPQTVVCSVRGYGVHFLKILVPELADITLLDHRNRAEAAPCIASGACEVDLSPPADLLDPSRPTERVKVEVKHTKVLTIDETAPQIPGETDSRCRVELHEDILTDVRGRVFTHNRILEAGTRKLEDCR